MKIGIVGTGRMGTAFAKRLIETGHEVSVWNRTPERMRAAEEAGAAAATGLRQLAACDVILISLTDADAVSDVVGRLAAADIAGRVVIDTSTLLPSQAQAIAGMVAAAGAEFVECPVGGTVAPALKGQLIGMAGGTNAAFARARPILELLCRRVEHLGPAGNGARMKLAINLPLALYWQTLGEALALLKGAGISAETAVSIIGDSSAGPTVLKNRAQVVVDTLNGVAQPGTFDINGLRKDLRLALQFAAMEGQELALASAAGATYDAAVESGLGGLDGASLARFVAG